METLRVQTKIDRFMFENMGDKVTLLDVTKKRLYSDLFSQIQSKKLLTQNAVTTTLLVIPPSDLDQYEEIDKCEACILTHGYVEDVKSIVYSQDIIYVELIAYLIKTEKKEYLDINSSLVIRSSEIPYNQQVPIESINVEYLSLLDFVEKELLLQTHIVIYVEVETGKTKVVKNRYGDKGMVIQ